MGEEPGSEARLPDFFVIGAARAGTTSLAKYLDPHPGVFMSARKELNFFNRVEPAPELVARYSWNFRHARPDQVAGEASPSYLHSADAPRRLASVVPEARLVAILRNPIDRAYSHYWWRRLWPAEDREFAEAICDELAGRAPRGRDYLSFGRYHEQLERVVSHYPREAVLVLLLDDLQHDAAAVFTDVCLHIGAASDVHPAIVGERINSTVRIRSHRVSRRVHPWRNATGIRRSVARAVDAVNTRPFVPPPMDQSLRQVLAAYFAEPNAQLAKWLDRDLSAWE